MWTVGHSTHALEAFLELLHRNGVVRVADVRTVPCSLRHPHFRSDELATSLPRHGVGYVHLPALGGWRRPSDDPSNAGWRNRSFRGYADYAQTPAFREGVAELCRLAADAPTAMMCSEALWWRCHRRLVADRLLVDGHEIWHIGSDGRASAHRLTPFAVVRDGDLTYPDAGSA